MQRAIQVVGSLALATAGLLLTGAARLEQPHQQATNTPGVLIVIPPATATATQLPLAAQPTATPTDRLTAEPTATDRLGARSTSTPTPTDLPLTIVSPTPTAGALVGQKPPTATPHEDPYDRQFPLTLPSPTPTPPSLAGPQVPNLYITAIEVTQGMQDLKNDMPLVEDRWTAVRVYVCTEGGDWTDVRAGLQGWRGGNPMRPAPGKPAGMALAPNNGPITAHEDCGSRIHLNDSFYFYLPSSWRKDHLHLRAFVYGTDPHAPFEDEPYADDNFSAVDVTFHPANTAIFRYIPLHLHQGYDSANPDFTFFPTGESLGAAGGWQIAYDMFRMHPISELSVQLANEVVAPPAHGAGNEWELDDTKQAAKPLNRLQWFRYWEDNAPWFVGMVSPQFLGQSTMLGLSRMGKGVSWVIMNPNSSSSTPWHIAGGSTLAHELGHLAGRKHAACADANHDGVPDEYAGGAVDEDFPNGFPDCSLAPVDPRGFYGFDVYYELWPFLNQPTVISNDPAAPRPHRGSPLMGYGAYDYTSAYNYCNLLSYYGVPCNAGALDLAPESSGGGGGSGGGGVGPHADCTPDPGPVGAHPPRPTTQWELCLTSAGQPDWYYPQPIDTVIAVSGSIDPTGGAASFDSVARIGDPPPSLLDGMVQRRLGMQADGTTSEYHLSLETADGTALAIMPLVDSTTYHLEEPDVEFSEILPDLPEGAVVRVRQGDRVLGEIQASASAPSVDVLDPGATAVQPPFDLQWEAADADGDPLTYTVLYSADGGETWRTLADELHDMTFHVDASMGLPGSDRGMFRVIADDGFNTGSDDSLPVYRLPNQGPLPLIYGPGDTAVFPSGAVVVLTGAASDPEDGPLTGDSLRWASDMDGELGAGPEVRLRDLSAGEHVITLTATDSQGLSATTRVRVAVDPNVVQWRPGDEELAQVGDLLTGFDPMSGRATAPSSRWPPLAGVLALGLLGLAGAAFLIVGLLPMVRKR